MKYTLNKTAREILTALEAGKVILVRIVDKTESSSGGLPWDDAVVKGAAKSASEGTVVEYTTSVNIVPDVGPLGGPSGGFAVNVNSDIFGQVSLEAYDIDDYPIVIKLSMIADE